MIALWNPVTKKHVLFLTNANIKRLPLRIVGQIYRLRWQIELVFKELKSFSQLRKFLTGNAYIAQGFILGRVLCVFNPAVPRRQCSAIYRLRFEFSQSGRLIQDFYARFHTVRPQQICRLISMLDRHL